MVKKTTVATAFMVAILGTCNTNTLVYAGKYVPNTIVLEQIIETTADTVNIRSGPGLSFPVTTTLAKGAQLDVLGMLGNWYVVYLPDGTVGVMANEFAKVVKIGDNLLPQGSDDGASPPATSNDQETLFALVNASRSENKLPPYEWDEKLNKVAQLKADDMAKNNYFDHQSATYGTPFKMLKDLGIDYKSASENLATNNSVGNAHIQIMSHPANRTNILNTRFSKMGIGIANSQEYGKIIVQLFIQ